jgi:hypothetical protein
MARVPFPDREREEFMRHFRISGFKAAVAAGAISLGLAMSVLATVPASASTAKATSASVGTESSVPQECLGYYDCLWYSPGMEGSMWGSYWLNNPDIKYSSTYLFFTPGAGRGEYVRNNAASVGSGSSFCATVYYYINYGGPSQTVGAYQGASLVPILRNEDASIRVENC